MAVYTLFCCQVYKQEKLAYSTVLIYTHLYSMHIISPLEHKYGF